MIRFCDILSRSNMAVRSYGPDMVLGNFALCPWYLRYDLGSRLWHILGSWTIIVWNIIQIHRGSEELWPGQGFWVCVHFDLDIRDMTFSQGHDTSLGYGHKVCEILSRSNMAVRSYGGYQYTQKCDVHHVCSHSTRFSIGNARARFDQNTTSSLMFIM